MVCIVLTILIMVISQATLCSNTMYFQTNKKAISHSKQKQSAQGFGVILQFYLVSRQVIPIAHDHRRQTSRCSGCRCTHCFFSLVVLNKSRILINKSQILILHPLFSGSFGANAHDFSHNLNEVLIILDDIQVLILFKICHIWTLCWPYRKDGGDEEGQLTCQKIFSINSFWLYQSCKEANRQKFSNDGSSNQ